MDNRILEAIEEMESTHYSSVEDALKVYSPRELLDIFLRYEGILGYTDTIISVMMSLGFNIAVDDSDFMPV